MWARHAPGGLVLRDRLLTPTRWIAEHADTLGRRYANELRRHFWPVSAG